MSDPIFFIFSCPADGFSPASQIDGFVEQMIMSDTTFHLADSKSFIWPKYEFSNGRNG